MNILLISDAGDVFDATGKSYFAIQKLVGLPGQDRDNLIAKTE